MNFTLVAAVAGLLKEARRRKTPGVITRLREAKEESDRRNYGRKHTILRELLRQRPGSFEVDSERSGMVGLTHPATGFRIHMPRAALPEAFVKVLHNRRLTHR